MYLLPGRVSPRSGSVSGVSGVGTSSAPTLGTLDTSSRLNRDRLEPREEMRGPATFSAGAVMAEINSLRQRMDHITDQLELLTARLPHVPNRGSPHPSTSNGAAAAAAAAAAANGPLAWSATDEASSVEDDEGPRGVDLNYSVLRSKLELQNVRLASEYAALLPLRLRRGFLKDFSHFFSNSVTAPQAFRAALSLLPLTGDEEEDDNQQMQQESAHVLDRNLASSRGDVRAPGARDARAAAYVVSDPMEENFSERASEVPLFSLVKDDIYRDVALFITANEDRPQFLQDLFSLLQQCSSDYLRQRCINSLQDIVASVLSDADGMGITSDTLVYGSNVDALYAPSGGRAGYGAVAGVSSGLPSAIQTPHLGSAIKGSRPGTAGSAIRTHSSVTDPVGYDYDEAAADIMSVPTPADGSVHSGNTDDPIFGRDPLTETMVFQGSANDDGLGLEEFTDGLRRASGAAANGSSKSGFDQLLARLDESLRRSALNDRMHYPEDILPSGGEFSDDGSRTDSTMDTSNDDPFSMETASDQHMIDAVHKYLSSLSAEAVLDGDTVEAVSNVISFSIDGGLDAAMTVAVKNTLGRYLGQPIRNIGALAVANVAEVLADEMVFRRVASEVDASYARQLQHVQQESTHADAAVPTSKDDPVNKQTTPSSATAPTPAAVLLVAAVATSVSPSDVELDNKRDDAMAAACEVPDDRKAEKEGEEKEEEESANTVVPSSSSTPAPALVAEDVEETQTQEDGAPVDANAKTPVTSV